VSVRVLFPGVDFPVPFDDAGNVLWPEANPLNPYFIVGPALISFSGGRTSAFMLFQILWAHGGKLPDDVHVCFANTGKEREETLRFVHECESRWSVKVSWLEWRRPDVPKGTRLPPEQRFEEVGYNSAARNGEPFEALIESRAMLPNPVTRYCTSALKINTMDAFMRAQGYARWNNAVGLRWDEMHRVFKQLARNETGNNRYTAVMPMAKQATKVTRPMVLDWWARQPFNLQLRGYEGNCDLCFLKGEKSLKRLIRDNPGVADWWTAQERKAVGRTRDPRMANFNKAFTYAELTASVKTSPLLDLDYMSDEDEFDAECGLWCAGEAA
jgi:3'-phosphoadenosine 5'-phosphosulfate sulfotransferase (PAPS reductase)/FAD synthetase